jgi:hypothetical protein
VYKFSPHTAVHDLGAIVDTRCAIDCRRTSLKRRWSDTDSLIRECRSRFEKV